MLPEHLDDPKSVIALGAARLERKAAHDSSVNERPLAPGRRRDPAASRLAATAPTDPAAPDPNATEIDVPAPPEAGRRSPSHPGSR